MTTLVDTVCPAPTVTERSRPPLLTLNPSPARRGRIVVRLFFTGRLPVSSLPEAVVAYGEVARSCNVAGEPPVLTRARFVTATLLWVMNFVVSTRIEPLVKTLL